MLNALTDERNFKLQRVTDLNENLDPMRIYMVVNGKQKLHAALLCPCGCKTQILLNLLPDYWPYWKIKNSRKNGITISPSIWLTRGCKSHFFIRKGKLLWVKNYHGDYTNYDYESFSIKNS